MCLQKRIKIVQKIMVSRSGATDVINPADACRPDGKISSFGAVTTAVLNMHEKLYSSSYSCINNDGGVSYNDCSQTAMISILQSNTNRSNKKLNIKPIGTLCFKEALKNNPS